MRRILGHDPLNGLTEYFHYDKLTGNVVVETRQDVEPNLDMNKAMANDADYSHDGIKNNMWHFASIPVIVQLRWLTEYGSKNWPMRPGNEQLLFKLLNSPEWKYLKTTSKVHLC